MIKAYLTFLWRCVRLSFVGDWRYYLWMGMLSVIILLGLNAYAKQLVHGMVVTGMSDQVSWGVYIANYTFLVGIAAAAVMLIIPVYIYKKTELDDLVIFAELLAISAILMCLAFVMVDLGRPDRFWHMIPGIGKLNFPRSMLSWDIIVLNGYLLLMLHICGYLLYCRYRDKKPLKWLYTPVIVIAIGWAFAIQLVEAFLYVGLGGRPFWNTAIIGPRLIVSAFAAGPALIILALQIIRSATDYNFSDRAIQILRSIIQVTMLLNIFLLINELFKEFYTQSLHAASANYLYFGLHEHRALVPWIWTAIACNIIAVILLVIPLSKKLVWLNVACILTITGIWIEKGMGLVIPGFIPTPLGEIVEYTPTLNETIICLGIWAFGLLIYTISLRITVPVLQGQVSKANEGEPELQFNS